MYTPRKMIDWGETERERATATAVVSRKPRRFGREVDGRRRDRLRGPARGGGGGWEEGAIFRFTDACDVSYSPRQMEWAGGLGGYPPQQLAMLAKRFLAWLGARAKKKENPGTGKRVVGSPSHTPVPEGAGGSRHWRSSGLM